MFWALNMWRLILLRMAASTLCLAALQALEQLRARFQSSPEPPSDEQLVWYLRDRHFDVQVWSRVHFVGRGKGAIAVHYEGNADLRYCGFRDLPVAII